MLENRGSQVSFSFLGQDVVKILGKKGIKMKEDWKRDFTHIKLDIAKRVAKYLPDLEVHAAEEHQRACTSATGRRATTERRTRVRARRRAGAA